MSNEQECGAKVALNDLLGVTARCEMECKCDMRTRLVGDGCEACNPALALELASETIAEQTAEIERLRSIVPGEVERLNDELCEENDRLREDAERYRWLRTCDAEGEIAVIPYGELLMGERLDAAIDAAMLLTPNT